MKHCLFTIAVGVSSLLWLVATILWIRSYFVADNVCYYSRGADDEPGDHGDLLDEREIISRNGHILFQYSRSDNRMPASDNATDQLALPLRPFIKLWHYTPRRSRYELVDGVERGELTTTLPRSWGGFVSGEEYYRGANRNYPDLFQRAVLASCFNIDAPAAPGDATLASSSSPSSIWPVSHMRV